MGRIGRSFQLTAQSYRILMQDKELMVLPLLSGVAVAFVAASFFFGFGLSEKAFRQREPLAMVQGFLFYVVTYAVSIFFQAAVIAGATERLRGGDPTIGSALSAAGRRMTSILVWALVAATVGVVLRAVQERVGFLGKIVVAVIGAAWSLATFFIVPVLVLEEKPIGESFKRSLSIFKTTWSESMVGGITLGAAAMVAWVTLVAVVGLLAWAGAGLAAIAVGAIGAVGLIIFFSALQGIYVASLYRYATEGHATSGFDPEALAGYTARMRQGWGESMAWGRRIAQVFYRVPRVGYQLGIKRPTAPQRIAQILSGEMGYGDIAQRVIKRLLFQRG